MNETPSNQHLLQKSVWMTLGSLEALHQQTGALRFLAEDRVLTLSGLVATEAQKFAAEKTAESVSGVKQVIDAIHVGAFPFRTEQETLHKENREQLPYVNDWKTQPESDWCG